MASRIGIKRTKLLLASIPILLGIVVCIVALILFVVIFLNSLLIDYRVRQSLRVYENARLISDDKKRWGAGVAVQSLYYWTRDQTGDVLDYYEVLFGPFIVSGDQYGRWMITAFNVNDSSQKYVPSLADSLTHDAFCDHYSTYECVSIALVDASQKELYQLAINSPSNFRHLTPPPSLSSIPPNGTLIVYSYYVEDG